MAKQRAKHGTKRSPVALIVGFAVFIVLLGLLVFSVLPGLNTQGNPAAESVALPDAISVAQAKELYDQGVYFLDVRTQEEWEAGHIPEAAFIPLQDLQSRANEVPKDREVVIICRSGNRSAQARDLLESAGWEQVTSVSGGMNEWMAAGYPSVTGP